MKKLLSLAAAGAALALVNVPADAKEKAARGGMARARGEVRQQAVQQPSRTMQSRARTAANVERRIAPAPRVQTDTRARIGTRDRTVTRRQPSVAFGGQTQAGRRERSVATDRTDVRRDVSRTRDRVRDRDRDRDRDWDRDDRRFRRPPIATWRNWDRDRIHSWNNHRWHWYGGSWVIVGASPDFYYYDEPISTTYVATSGSTVVAVQRELAREGYDPGPIDGVLGGQTRTAIAAFQRDNGLAATGRIDSALLNELNLQ